MYTHLPVLFRVADISEGPILEMGTGYFSTLVLNWISQLTGREVISYESNKSWYEKAKKYERGNHKVIFVKSFDEAPIEDRHWGMVFIDQGPNGRRHVDVIRLAKANNADYIIMHDTEERHDNQYHYSKIWDLFKYRYDHTKYVAHTSVVSNLKDLSNL